MLWVREDEMATVKVVGKKYTGVARIRLGGRIVFEKTKIFDSRGKAYAWAENRELVAREEKPWLGARREAASVSASIDKYIAELEAMDRISADKKYLLRRLGRRDIGSIPMSDVDNATVFSFLQRMTIDEQREPSTTKKYFSYFRTFMRYARTAWSMEVLDDSSFSDIAYTATDSGLISEGKRINRRPLVREIAAMFDFWDATKSRGLRIVPMKTILMFEIMSTRRISEIVTLRWDDYEPERKRILVRNLKDPRRRVVNEWSVLPDEAIEIIERMPRSHEFIFPFKTRTIQTSFDRARYVVGAPDLRGHDLRHEGISRLFELGLGVEKVSLVSLHKRWETLQRYTHLSDVGIVDKWNEFNWRERLETFYPHSLPATA